MPSFRQELQEHTLELVWSLWAELGVSGWRRHHTSHGIDPEPLVIFTAWLGDLDPRLRDESTDWCIHYGRYVAGTRLKNFLSEEPDDVRRGFGPYAATVGAHSPLRWPYPTKPRRYQPTNRSKIESFRSPSLISLRLRALLGTTARAEIVRIFLSNPDAAMTAADLAPGVGYTKRNVAEALDALRLAGLLEVAPWRNQLKYRLTRAKELASLAGDLPVYFSRWRPLFRILRRALEISERAEELQPVVQLVETDRTLREMGSDLQGAHLTGPVRGSNNEMVWPAFTEWVLALARGLASGDSGTWPWTDWTPSRWNGGRQELAAT